MTTRFRHAAVAAAALSSCVLAAVALVGPAAGAADGWRVIAKARSDIGAGNSSMIFTQARRPHALAIRLSVQPSIKATVEWNAACWKGPAGATRRTVLTCGRFSTQQPILKRLRLGMTSPDGCLVSINAVAGPDISGGTAYNVAIRLELLQQ